MTRSPMAFLVSALVLSTHLVAADTPGASRLNVSDPLRLQRPIVTFAISGAARSPIEAQVGWSEPASAPGYDVIRNGVAIAAVGSDVRTYIDATLRPNASYVYQIRARTLPPPDPNAIQTLDRGQLGGVAMRVPPVPPAPPRLTGEIQVTTPRALAPTAVIAKAMAPGVAQLSWNPRPESLTYLVTRNGAPLRVTSTPTAAVLNDTNLAPGTYRYTVQTLMRTADGADVLGESSAPVTLMVRPFNVVAFGDSVMWGQGLAEPSKFVSKVRLWLQGQLGKEVRLLSFARSGAVYGPLPTQDETPALQELITSSGEIPRNGPTIMNQALVIAPSRITPADVDLVLLDGCINDVGVMNILNPDASDQAIATLTQQNCGPGVMDARLSRVHALYPNARILLTGYFPIVSNLSDITAVAVLMTNVGALSAAVAPLFGVPIDPLTGVVAGAVASEVLRSKAVSHSNTFHAVSTALLTTSVVTANSHLAGNRIRFVPIPFAPLNAYAAPDTWLWLVPTPGIPISNAKDEVFEQRVRACTAVPNMPPSCIPASMGHPNVKGAQAYADAITASLGEFLPNWRAVHAPVQLAQM